jgi:hypothetical protein
MNSTQCYHPGQKAMLKELEHALNNECNADDGYLSALMQCHETDLPVTLRVSKLNVRFFKLFNSVMTKEVYRLQATYIKKSKEIELARNTDPLKSNTNTDQLHHTNSFHDNNHHRLIDNTKRSLLILERQLANKNGKGDNSLIQPSSLGYPSLDVKLQSSSDRKEYYFKTNYCNINKKQWKDAFRNTDDMLLMNMQSFRQ